MATTPNTTIPAETTALVAAVPPPAQGGSYLVDEQTGEHTLTERTQEFTKE